MNLKERQIIDDYNLLIIADIMYIHDEELEILFDFIHQGGNALIAAGEFSLQWEDTLDIHTFGRFQSILDLSLDYSSAKIRFCAPELEEKIYTVPLPLCLWYMKFSDNKKSDTPAIQSYVISETSDNHILSLRCPMGKGNLILASNPLIYTNYGILNDSINEYIRYHLSYLQGRPLMRTEYYHAGSQAGKSRSEFRYLLSQPPLKWAFYLTLATILIFMVFTAKRKQRVIPLIKPPANKMMDFVRSIAQLYLRKNGNVSIVSKKYIYWAEKLKRKYGIDVINENHDMNLYARIASKTGQPIEEVRNLLIYYRAIEDGMTLSDDEMMDLITKMNTNILGTGGTMHGA
jgi:hypothetical protein